MTKFWMHVPLLAAISLSACAQTYEETMTDVVSNQTVEKPMLENSIKEPVHTQSEDNELTHKVDESAMHDKQAEFWVKKPGTLVYNGAHEITRSLRLQPNVSIHKVVDGWGLINPEKDEWVNMSDLTDAKPAGMMRRPEEGNEMPRITVEEMMKDAKQ